MRSSQGHTLNISVLYNTLNLKRETNESINEVYKNTFDDIFIFLYIDQGKHGILMLG